MTTTQLTIVSALKAENFMQKFTTANPSLNFMREIGFAIQAVQANPYLSTLPQESILQSVYNVALTGLSLNPVLKEAYLVPFKGKCTLMPGYQGLIKIITDGGAVTNVSADIVYDKDEFEIIKGSEPQVIHRPKFLSSEIIGAYAIAFIKTGSIQIEFMTLKELQIIKGRSAAGSSGQSPWSTDFNEMCRKTVIRRLYKYLPKSYISEIAQKVLSLDDEAGELNKSKIVDILKIESNE